MASSSGKQITPLRKLFTEPQCFDFFQAVRLLSRAHNQQLSNFSKNGMIGGDSLPHDEFIRFKSAFNHNFPVGLIEKIKIDLNHFKDQKTILEMFVSFMGLTGPAGTLPRHYSEMITHAINNGNLALKDFFDLFSHRLISLFYAGWEKYHFFAGYERAKESASNLDPMTELLLSLSGIGTATLQKRLHVDDEINAFYAGLLSQQIRSSVTLENLLADYFKMPIQVLQFQGKWLPLSEEDQSILSSKKSMSCYQQLGQNFILGKRCWSIQDKFRIYIGPLTYQDFKQVLPSGSLSKSLIDITRLYCGMELDFDIQIELLANEVPYCQLNHSNLPNLGWNTWLKSRPLTHNANQVVLSVNG